MASKYPTPVVRTLRFGLSETAADDSKRSSLANNLFMTETQNIPWKRLSVEAAAIVASILLAFTIDAWWGDRQKDEAEREVL